MSDPRIVALDLSLTSTGVADWWEPDLITYSIKPRQTGARRLTDIRSEIMESAEAANLVLIEGYSYGSVNSQAHSLGELGGVVRVALYEDGIPYLVVSPSEIKKYATGKGNASKDAVLQQAVHRSGRTFGSNDEADAWWLLQMALDHYGLPCVLIPAVNRSVLDKIDWPILKAEVPA